MMKQLRRIYQATEIENSRVFLDLLEPDKHARVLDLGCGDGSFTLKIGERIGTTELYGVEILDQAVQNCKASGIRAYCLDLNNTMPFNDASFDVVCASQVFEHLSHTDLFVREIHRLLRPEGYAVISTPNLAVWHNIICIFFGWQLFGTGISDEITVGNPLQLRYKQRASGDLGFSHCRVATHKGLRESFQHHGFRVEKMLGVGYYPLPVSIGRVLTRLDARHSLLITMKVRRLSVGRD